MFKNQYFYVPLENFIHQSDGQFYYSLVLVALYEIVNKVSIEDSLNHSCYKRGDFQSLPIVYPSLRKIYQLKR
jgi:hypothetical protein